MSNLLQIIEGHKAFGPKVLFEEATFSIEEGEHVGVIGPNGAGKSTLFKILVEQDELDSGEFVRKKGLKLGYLSQHDDWTPETRVEDYLSQGTSMPLWELKSLGRGLGLGETHFNSKVRDLSGGYRTRIKLLYLLGTQPDLLLLDEPTNYLDLESVLTLEKFLQETSSSFLLISHDREFLRRTTDHILEVESGDIVKFNGGLDDYFEQKQILRSQLETAALSQSQKKAQILEFVARFGAKASKAKQAQSRLKQVEKMEDIDLKPLPIKARIKIPPPKHCGKTIMTLDQVSLGYGEKIILSGVSFSIQRGDHIAVVGVNGAGKSTLLKALANLLDAKTGAKTLGYEVSIGYYAQHVGEALDPKLTVLESLLSAADGDVSVQDVKNLAGSLLFSGDDMDKRISVLSGGEKARVAFGQILLQRSPFLILDEPTNHLDFQTVEALTEALNSYEGTVVVVSHDRSFTRRVGKKILEVRDGKVGLYLGSYDEYVWSQSQKISSRPEEGTQLPLEGPSKKTNIALQKNSTFNSAKRLKQIEKEIQKVDQELESLLALQNQISLEPGFSAQRGQELKVMSEKIDQLKIQKNSLEEEWLILSP